MDVGDPGDEDLVGLTRQHESMRGAPMRQFLHQLEVLVTLASTLSFSRKAEILHVTQCVLTKIVHDIEAEVGVPVFDRTTRFG